MESEWIMARMQLYQLLGRHPDWSTARLARVLGYSISWVKKWRKRFREAQQKSWRMFVSQSRAPKSHARQVAEPVIRAILGLRDTLVSTYQRTVGAKTILYHLHRDGRLKQQGYYVPTSTHTIWRILKDGGRIVRPLRVPHPLERPEPMAEWEFDFGLMSLGSKRWLEFFVVVDRGTSILVDTQVAERYHADTALQAVAQLLVANGLPDRLRFDRDPRLVGSWSADGYPSALVRFVLCLGIQVDICPPQRPDLKPFVERCIRTLKYECLYAQRPQALQQADGILLDYRHFYNADRAHQGLSCGNRPPFEAFPSLPVRPTLPTAVDPDCWLAHYHGRIYRRRVSSSGHVMIDKYTYSIGKRYARQKIAINLNAKTRQFHVLFQGQPIKQLPIKGLRQQMLPFQDYLKMMLEEARSIDRHLLQKARRAQAR